MAQLAAAPSPSLGRDPWPLPPPNPLVDRGALSSRSRSWWRKAAAVREFVRFGIMALSWQTLGHPVACPLACRAGVPRTVAGVLVRLGFGPSCDLGRSLDKFRIVGDDLAALNSRVHSFAEASTGFADLPASYKFGSGPSRNHRYGAFQLPKTASARLIRFGSNRVWDVLSTRSLIWTTTSSARLIP